MESLLRDYFPILVFLVIAGVVSAALVGGSMLVARQAPDTAKLSPYECGFEPLFPWAVSLGDLGAFGFWSMFVFLAVLTVGFAYEWKKGALEWE